MSNGIDLDTIIKTQIARYNTILDQLSQIKYMLPESDHKETIEDHLYILECMLFYAMKKQQIFLEINNGES